MKYLPILVISMMLLAACAQVVAPLGAVIGPGEAQATPAETMPAGASVQFRTDFTKHSVPYDEFLSGGPPKDGIPAIDEPRYTSMEAADQWLESPEPVILVEIGGKARAPVDSQCEPLLVLVGRVSA